MIIVKQYTLYIARSYKAWSQSHANVRNTKTLTAVHAFTYGGIGMITLGMMARLSLGHTGRNVFDPPKILGPLFACLFAGAIVRVVAPMLILPRVDGRYG